MARLRDVAAGRPSGVVRLPGIGERLDVTDVDGAPVGVVRRLDGTVEVHSTASPCVLDAVTASSVAAFATGRFTIDPKVAARVADVLGGLAFDWVRLEPGDAAIGRTIAELAVRQRTGVTVVAVLRGSQPIVAPDPTLRFEAGDDLIIACRDEDRDGFVAFLGGGG
ncbi:MAG: TrkA C-terminal domain-containing protein [Acidimicrobiales bacterium]